MFWKLHQHHTIRPNITSSFSFSLSLYGLSNLSNIAFCTGVGCSFLFLDLVGVPNGGVDEVDTSSLDKGVENVSWGAKGCNGSPRPGRGKFPPEQRGTCSVGGPAVMHSGSNTTISLTLDPSPCSFLSSFRYLSYRYFHF